MEQQMKERLVGAAVLVTLGVVLIPLLLDGPDSGPRERAGLELPAADRVSRRHTIEIERDADAPAGPGRALESRPEPDSARAPAAAAAPSQAAASGTVATPTSAPPADTPPAKPTPAVEEAEPGTAAAPATKAATPSPGVTGGWAVQVGSFGSRDNADRLRRRLGEQGYPVFLTEIESGGRTLHRVRVGPYPDRDRAAAAARQLAAVVKGGTVVRQDP